MPKIAKSKTDPSAKPAGLACPECGCRHLPVLRTQSMPSGYIRRVRECRNCGRVVITREAQPAAL